MAYLDHQAIGQRIKTMREQRRLSQQQVAELIGIAQNSVSNLETGHTKLSLELAVIIAEAFGVSVDVLVVRQ